MEIKKLPNREQVTIRLPVELYKELQKEAVDKGLDVKSIIVFGLWEWVGSFRGNTQQQQ